MPYDPAVQKIDQEQRSTADSADHFDHTDSGDIHASNLDALGGKPDLQAEYINEYVSIRQSRPHKLYEFIRRVQATLKRGVRM